MLCSGVECHHNLPFTNSLTQFHFTMLVVTIIGGLMVILLILNYIFRLSETKWIWFRKCLAPWMFPPLDILLEYWIEQVTFGLLYAMSTFPTRAFYRGVPGFATGCHCGVWCRGLPPRLLCVGQLFGNLAENDNRFVSLTIFWLF